VNGDPVRDETRALAEKLAAPSATRPSLAGPPPRVAAPTSPAPPTQPPPTEAGREDPSPSAPPSVPEEPAPRRSRRPPAPAPPAATVAGAPVTVTLTRDAAVLLEAARRSGATVREVFVDAVRSSVDELRRRHPPVQVDPSTPIPYVAARRRRRLEGYGVKVPVRLYRPEKEALDALADELGLSVSAMVTEALVHRHSPGRLPGLE